MNTIRRYALLGALVFPVVALAADTTGTVTLTSGMAVNFSTGATGTSGGDAKWTGSELDWVSGAKGYNYGNGDGEASAVFGEVTQTFVSSVAAILTSTPLLASQLPADQIFIYETGSGKFGKALVTAQNGSSITIQFDTFGGGGGSGGGGTPGGPQITKAVNNYSFLPDGFPNSGIAPSSIISIFGTALAASTPATVTLNSTVAPGLPTSWNGATVKLTVGSTTVTLGIYFAIPTQIAAVVPAGTPTGPGQLVVIVNGVQSNSFTVQVVPVALGLDTYYGTGSGLVVATDATTGKLINYTNSAQPMEELTLWGSGPGGDTADPDLVYTTTPHAVNQANATVYFGTVQVTPVYVGSSGFPGLFQVNVFVPQGVSGCNVSLVVIINGVPSNFVTIPVSNGPTCSDPLTGITGSQLNTLGSQSTVSTGVVEVGQFASSSGTINEGLASFYKVSGVDYSASSSSSSFISIGSCVVSEIVSTTGTGTSTITETPLDAGNTINLQGPVGSYTLQKSSFSAGTYLPSGSTGELPANAIPSTGGAFTFTGSGGTGANSVGGFTATVNLPNPLLTWTNQSSAANVNKSQGYTFQWSGGGANSYVYMFGDSYNTTTGAIASFYCYAHQGDGHFTIPVPVLAILPTGMGSLTIENLDAYSTFTDTGLDYGIAIGYNAISQETTWN